MGQRISFEFQGTTFSLAVVLVEGGGEPGAGGDSTRGMLVKDTALLLEAAHGSGIKVGGGGGLV